MRRALRLAERGRGRTSPNPMVGAVVVREGRVVGEGWHGGAGLPHAEINALDAAGDAARDATLFVTLEPCVHEGRTPPCTPRVISSGVQRVVIGTIDPNPVVNGRGADALSAGGLAVEVGLLETEARRLIEPFEKRIRTGIPFVTAKSAATLDGRVAAADGSSRWVTGPGARRDVHRLRAASDAVLVGIGTVLADDPQLTCRLRGYSGKQPLRVILDSAARTPLSAKVLDRAAPTLIATTDKAPEDGVEMLRSRGADIVRLPSREGRVDLAATLEELGRRGVVEVLLEGGPTVLGDAIERSLVDRFVFYLAPKLLGPTGIPAVAAVLASNIADARELTVKSVRRVGADIKVEARVRQ